MHIEYSLDMRAMHVDKKLLYFHELYYNYLMTNFPHHHYRQNIPTTLNKHFRIQKSEFIGEFSHILIIHYNTFSLNMSGLIFFYFFLFNQLLFGIFKLFIEIFLDICRQYPLQKFFRIFGIIFTKQTQAFQQLMQQNSYEQGQVIPIVMKVKNVLSNIFQEIEWNKVKAKILIKNDQTTYNNLNNITTSFNFPIIHKKQIQYFQNMIATVAKNTIFITLNSHQKNQVIIQKQSIMSDIFFNEQPSQLDPRFFSEPFNDQIDLNIPTSISIENHQIQPILTKKKRLDNNTAREYQQIALKIIKKMGPQLLISVQKLKKKIWQRGTIIFMMADMKKNLMHQVFLEQFEAEIKEKNLKKYQQFMAKTISKQKYEFDVNSNKKAIEGCKLYLEGKFCQALFMVFVSQKGKNIRQRSKLIKDWEQLKKIHSTLSQKQNFSNISKI